MGQVFEELKLKIMLLILSHEPVTDGGVGRDSFAKAYTDNYGEVNLARADLNQV